MIPLRNMLIDLIKRNVMSSKVHNKLTKYGLLRFCLLDKESIFCKRFEHIQACIHKTIGLNTINSISCVYKTLPNM